MTFEKTISWESLPEWDNSNPVILLVWFLDSGEVYSVRLFKYVKNRYTPLVYANHLLSKPPFGKIEVMSSFTTEFKNTFTLEQKDRL
jgi:hypothetical protein